MLAVLFLVLTVLWLFDYIHIEGIPPLPDFYLFSINDHPITLWSILMLIFISWAISIIPSPIRQIISVFLILWILAVLGVIALADIPLASIIVLAILVGMIAALLRPNDAADSV